MTIETTETINLIEIDNLRRWAEYMPECFTAKLENQKYREMLISDRLIIHKINTLYSFIENITGSKIDLENENFHIGALSPEQHEEYIKLVKVPSLCIKTYADLKLSDEEKEHCYYYLEKCTKDNSFDIDKEVDNIDNYFLKSYIKYLLINHPKSDYISSTKNISENVVRAEKKLTKRFKQIENAEIRAWRNSRKRFYN